jgi:hypothetical protein
LLPGVAYDVFGRRYRLDLHPPHHRGDALAADLDSLATQQIAQHPPARERVIEMQLIDPRQVTRRHWPRLVIDAAPAQLQNIYLARQRQGVRTVDHRLALSIPALLSAPSKKSLSSVSSPILACSVLTSTAGLGRAPSGPNIPAAPSSSRDFQSVVWFGCTSKICANFDSVFSPFNAASGIFALNAAM